MPLALARESLSKNTEAHGRTSEGIKDDNGEEFRMIPQRREKIKDHQEWERSLEDHERSCSGCTVVGPVGRNISRGAISLSFDAKTRVRV